MANVVFKKGLLTNLPATYTEGTFYVTTDEHAIYLDVSNDTRIRLGDFQEFATLEALQANTNPSTTALYYVDDINCLAKWNGSEYIQINRDTGMTSVEVTGTGNAITAAVYDASGRKLTLTKGATYMTASDVDNKISAKVGDIGDKTVKEYVDKATEGIASDAALTALDERVSAAEGEIDALQAESHTHENKAVIDGITAEKVAAWDAAQSNAEATAAAELKKLAEGQVATNKSDIAGIKNGTVVNDFKAAEESIADAKKAGTEAMAEAQKKVASVTAGDASVTVAGTATAPTIAAKVSQDADNALELAKDGLKVVIPAAAEYSISKDTDSGDYAAVYHLTKNGANVGAAINIPKDMVVQSGSVVENPTGQPAGIYIELVLQNVADPLYINVGSLIEYVTSGSQAGDMIVVAVSDDHKVTATISDGAITLAKLHTDIQTAIGKAHTHDNKSTLDGITDQKVADWDDAVSKEHIHGNKDLLDSYSQTEANLADAVAKKHSHANATELDKIEDGDKAKWDAAEAKAHEHANKAELDKIETGDKAKWDQAVSDIATVKGDYLKSSDKTELEGKVNEEKARAEEAEAKALSDAKAYTDAALTWGSF